MDSVLVAERKRFREKFGAYKDKRIVLYGIGRRTATLVLEQDSFNFVGLMDRDPENIGKKYYGIPVISLDEAEKSADLIIINAPETYWEIIFSRIEHAKIPVYFHNGEIAHYKKRTVQENENEYWNKSLSKLEIMLNEYDIISFDLFDTLITRTVLRPEDVFALLNKMLHKKGLLTEDQNFMEMRNNIICNYVSKYYSLDELYEQLEKVYALKSTVIEDIYNEEITLEKKMILPRDIMVKLYHTLAQKNKELYIVSDMYLPKKIIIDILGNIGINISEKQIILSNELKMEKSDGTLWEYYSKNIVLGKKAIHIGDNENTDISMAIKYGIEAYRVMSVADMLKNSSVKELYAICANEVESLVIGKVIAKLFNNPFSLNQTKGQVVFEDKELWGYCIWGNVINSYNNWLINMSKAEGINRLFFLARDGYLLKQCYDYFVSLCPAENLPASEYLYVSRLIAMVISVNSKDDYQNLIQFPYIGTLGEFIKDRLGVIININENEDEDIQMPKDMVKVMQYLSKYEDEITAHMETERINYISYLRRFNLNEHDAWVDLGYYGSIQDRLNKVLQLDLPGLYFNCDISKENLYVMHNRMYGCFQRKEDEKAQNSFLKRKPQLLESLFTAPYGMVIGVDENGNRKCASSGHNQKYFADRLCITDGIKCFIKELWDLSDVICNSGNEEELFADRMYGILIENSSISEELRQIFVWDDALIQRRENPIFV